MKSLTVKIITGLLSVFLLTTIGNQIYYRLHDRHDTEEAVLVTINEDIPFKGVIIRDEKVITYDGSGVLDYAYPDGSKVSVGNTIAEVYSSEDDILLNDRISKIEDQISALQQAQEPGLLTSVQSETVRTGIDQKYKDLLASVSKEDYADVRSTKDSLALSMNIYSIVTGADENYDDAIKRLTERKNQLKKEAVKASGVITAGETGYFVSYSDGFEDKLSKSKISELTEKDIKNAIKGKAEPKSNAIGKMFTDYSCYIAGIIDTDKRISEGAVLSMTTNSSKNVYDVKVVSSKTIGADGKSLVIFSCNRLDETLVESRVKSFKLIFDEYQGIKVPRDAIRFRDNDKGVYVILGKDITFKKIDVIYEGDDFVLSKNTAEEDNLLLYDQILLEVVTSDSAEQASGAGSSEKSG
ncbi:MAG: hypothetical protein IJ871_01780 [Ruminococcus sp.]|nr:hypothetical protein [Ruminococcus sp.]MBR2303854.1 hypothetical protein [Ruminococcus sp.]